MSETLSYKCPCGAVHEFSPYAIAQMAAGNTLVHTCPECGWRNELEDFELIGEGRS